MSMVDEGSCDLLFATATKPDYSMQPAITGVVTLHRFKILNSPPDSLPLTQEQTSIPTEMFTRQIRQNLKLVTVKITNDPKNPFDF